MKMPAFNSIQSPAFAIGGVGGSGTRLLAKALSRIGCYIGHDLNVEHDNLTFTLLFKRQGAMDASDDEFDDLLNILFRSMTQPTVEWSSADRRLIGKAVKELGVIPLHPLEWREVRADKMQQSAEVCAQHQVWGWKEPNTHLVIDRLMTRLPRLKYVHVRRNGLDMAFSENQNQLKLWGQTLLGVSPSTQPEPALSLAYWCAAEQRVLQIVDRLGRHADFHVVDYDQLCADPLVQWEALLRFLNLKVDPPTLSELVQMVNKPISSGRYLSHGTSCFSENDLAFVRSLGYI